MMEVKTLQDVTAAVRELYNRATAAGRKRNWDYAIELLLSILAKEPALIPARQELRKYESEKSDQMGFFKRTLVQLKASLKMPQIKVTAKKDPFKAIRQYEKLLGEYLYNKLVLNALADAAVAREAFFIGIEALEIVRSKFPNNEANLRKLAEYYKETKDGMAYLRIFQEIANRHPGNLQIESELRAAAAFSTMHKANWEKEGSTQEKVVDREAALAEQIAEGTLHDANQAEVLVKKYTKELEKRESSDTRRRLAEAYSMLKQYDKAIEQLNLIQEKLGVMDPAIDKLIETAYLANIDAGIKELSERPEQYETPEKQIADLREHRAQYRFKRAFNRVETYPNDTQLRYELALLYFERNDFDHALEEFQKARRNPQRKRSCIVYIGRCLENKNQLDMAVDQFTEALAEMPEMSGDKMETLYYLALAYEALEQNDKALECFKDIYQTNVNYKDVGERIKKHYQ
ncbi:MAG: tetratricopeptide repeat protein [Victivallaceae bacterium]|nr:tetratricopeptide repeat protein [Victivallaceae bacterium]